jgi:hypothetical protein
VLCGNTFGHKVVQLPQVRMAPTGAADVSP